MSVEAEKSSQAPIMESNGGLNEVQAKFVDFMLLFLGAFVFIAVPASVYRATLTGWLPLYNFHIVLGVVTVIVALMRTRISLAVKKALVCAWLFVVGIGSVFTFGLVAGGFLFLIFFNISVGFLYRPRIFLLSSGISLLVMLVAAWGFVSGQFKAPASAELYTVSTYAWAGVIGVSIPFVYGLFHAFSTFTQENQRLASQLRAIVETEPECVKMLAADGTLLDMNPAGLDMIDADSIDQVIGQPMQELVKPAYRADFMALLRQVFEGGSGKLEFEIRSLKGVDLWLETHAVPLRNNQGEISCLLSVTRDITERKQAEAALRESEARFRAIIETAPVPFTLNDEQQNVTYLNSSFIRTFGYTLEDIPTVTAWWPKAYPDPAYRQWVATTWQTHLEKAKRENKPFESMEVAIRCKDGSIKTALVGAEPIESSFAGIHLVSLFDITERKQAEMELLTLNETLAQRVQDETAKNRGKDLLLVQQSRHLVAAQEEARRRLSAELHDRTSPNLAAISINLNILATELSPEHATDVAERLEDTRALIEDTSASIREISADLRPPLLDYAGLCPALEGYAQQFSRRTGIAVKLECANHDARHAPDLESLLFRIFQEALTNCAKHAHATSVMVTLNHGGRPIVLTVADNGAGFDPEQLGKAGRPGLGLINMREMAEVADGRFIIESAPGKGTRIHVEI